LLLFLHGRGEWRYGVKVMRTFLAAAAVMALALAGCGREGGEIAPAADRLPEEPGYGEPAIPALPERSAEDYRALSGYGEAWFLNPGWPGEYAPGFAVLEAGVRLQGRARPNPADPQDIACMLPDLANYHMLNRERVFTDSLEFFTATQTFPLTIQEDVNIDYASAGSLELQSLALSRGDQLVYLRYLGEGFMVLAFEGQEYNINESELRGVSDIGNRDLVEHLWVRVSCLGGLNAWLLYDEVIDEPGIAPSPFTGFREASDILPEEVEQVRLLGLQGFDE
jgi:predicted small lipoprotein YifL